MLKLRPSALVSSRTAVDLPCEIETIRPWDSSSCMVRISIVVLLLVRLVYLASLSGTTISSRSRECSTRRLALPVRRMLASMEVDCHEWRANDCGGYGRRASRVRCRRFWKRWPQGGGTRRLRGPCARAGRRRSLGHRRRQGPVAERGRAVVTCRLHGAAPGHVPGRDAGGNAHRNGARAPAPLGGGQARPGSRLRPGGGA